MRLKLPDGTEVEASQKTLDRFWQLSGLAPRTNLEKLKGGHKRRVMKLADDLFPKEGDDDNLN